MAKHKLMTTPAKPEDIASTVERALAEDIGPGDITSQLIPADLMATANLYCRENAVLCGIPWVDEIFTQLDSTVEIQWAVADGDPVSNSQILATFTGKARSLLTAERCMLNFLQTLSATATHSRRLADLIAHTSVKLLDTRKTLPGLRSAQKYAVASGGCFNHRMGLYDAFLIKENHINACGSISLAVKKARQLYPDKPVEVEVETLEQLEIALDAAVDIIMLDNFSVESIRLAVNQNKGRAKLEASGGINELTLVAIAATGVDFISVGSLTKNCKAVDLSLLFA